MNYQVEVTWKTLLNIAHSNMVNARVSEEYINFALMYTTDHIFPFLPTKILVNQDGEPTTSNKLKNCTKHSVSNPSFLFG